MYNLHLKYSESCPHCKSLNDKKSIVSLLFYDIYDYLFQNRIVHFFKISGVLNLILNRKYRK